MGKYDDQAEERSPANAAGQMGSAVSAGLPVADGRAEDFFSQGATPVDTFVLSSSLQHSLSGMCCSQR